MGVLINYYPSSSLYIRSMSLSISQLLTGYTLAQTGNISESRVVIRIISALSMYIN